MTAIESAPSEELTPQFPPLWRNRDYMLLWTGQLISVMGDRASTVAFPLLVLALTGSPARAGLLGLLGTLPYVLLSLPAGAFADRWNRKLTMIICDTGRALVLASIPVALALGHLTMTQLFLCVVTEGMLYVFFDLSSTASIPRLVPAGQLPAAMAQNTIMYTSAQLVGPTLGGALFGLARALPFLADAISYGASVVTLLAIRTPFQKERDTATARSLRHEILEGLRWVFSQPLIRFLAFLAFGFNIVFFSAGNYLILIVLARQGGAAPTVIGTVFTIGACGSLLGAVLVRRIQRWFTFPQIMVGTIWLLACIYPLYLLAPNLVALGAVAAMLSGLGTTYNVTQIGYRMALIPDQLQGRVNSVFRLIAFGGQPIGAGLIGVSLQVLGARPTVMLVAGLLVVMALATVASGAVRHAPPIEQVRLR